jgi:hypothetical protein
MSMPVIKITSISRPEKYLAKINKLNHQPSEHRLYKKITNNIKQLLKDSDLVCTAAQYGAEHLTNGKLAGNNLERSLSDVKKATRDKEGGNYVKLNECVSYALKSTNLKINKIKVDLQNLKPGQSLALRAGYGALFSSHATILYFERKENGRFLVRHLNTGDGVELHHYTIDNKRLKYKIAMEMDDVDEKNLCDSPFINQIFALQKIFPTNSVNKLYKTLNLLKSKAKILDINDRKLLAHPQTGGSCAVRATLALAHSLLDRDELRQLKTELKLKYLQKTYKYYKKTGGIDRTNIIVMLEIIQSLRKTSIKLYMPFPEELDQMEKTLHADMLTRRQKTLLPHLKKLRLKNLEEGLSEIYNLMKSHHFAEAYEILLKTRTMQIDLKSVNKSLVKKMLNISKRFEDLYLLSLENKCSFHLTVEVLNIFAGIFAKIFHLMNELEKTTSSLLQIEKIKKINKFCNQVWGKYKAVHVVAYYPDSPWTIALS